MDIVELSERADWQIEQLTELREQSVKATHTFLSVAEIADIKRYVPDALRHVAHLIMTTVFIWITIGTITLFKAVISLMMRVKS